MIVLLLFAFLAGIVTILSPCILPILPVVLQGTVSDGKRKPFGIVVGFIISFTFFTVLTSTLVKATGINPDFLRYASIFIIAFLGISLIVPQLQKLSEILFSKLARLTPNASKSNGFLGGLIVGLSIGLIWTPCVGPILAAVISLSLTTTITGAVVFITLAYALGTAIPMIGIIYLGRSLFTKVPFLFANLANIQKIFGVLMILTALAIATNTDRRIQEFLLIKFPQWGAGLTQLEDNKFVRKELEVLQDNKGKAELTLTQPAPELIVGGEWFNSEPRTMASLKGKVVLVDFWTYTCINCIRTLPYLREWNEKYKDKGLVIVGVHSPEFEFEKSPDNVKKAIEDYKLTYPVMQDNDFATWRAYSNRYWPAKYLVDAKGNVRYTHFGEGDYDETEKEIQKLLKESNETLQLGSIENPEYEIQTRTPELYLGYGRMDAINVKESINNDTIQTYTPRQSAPFKNTFDYSGRVLIADEYANPQANTKLRLRYESKNVFLVMRSTSGESKVKIYLDDKLVTSAYAGEDVKEGSVTIRKDQLYKLIQSPQQEEHVLTIEFLDDKTEIFAFTFG